MCDAPITVQHSADLVDNKLLQSQEQGEGGAAQKRNRKSTASMRKLKYETQQHTSNLKASCLLAVPELVDSELIDILAKYSGNSLGINPFSYAIYIRDYNSVKVLLENGYDVKNKTERFEVHTGRCLEDHPYILTPIDFLFLEEIKFTKWNGKKVIFKTSYGYQSKKDKITFRLLSELEPNEALEVREILFLLFEKTKGGPTPSWLKGFVHEINREGTPGSGKNVDVYKEMIKLKWNEITKLVFPEGKNEEIESAMFYDNEVFFEYTIRKNPGEKYLGNALNSVIKKILIEKSPERLEIWMKYFNKLLLFGASLNDKGNDGCRPIDNVQKFPDSSRKRMLLKILFENGVRL